MSDVAEPLEATPAESDTKPALWERARDYYREALALPSHSVDDARLAVILKLLYPRGCKQEHKPDGYKINPIDERRSLRSVLKAADKVIGHDPTRLRDILRLVLEHGIEVFGWKLPEVVPEAFPLPRDPPILPTTEAVYLPAAERLARRLHDGLARLPQGSPPAHAGVILLSAILDGGLLRRDLQHGILGVRREDLVVHNGGSWLRVVPVPARRRRPADADPDDQPQAMLWRLRPLTELLLLWLWRQDPSAGLAADDPWKALRAGFELLSVPKDERPRSLAALNQWARAYTALGVPPLLRELMAGRITSHGVSEPVLRRLCTGARVDQPDASLPTVQLRYEPSQARPAAPPATLSAEHKVLKSLLALIDERGSTRGKRREAIQRRLQAHNDTLGSVAWLVGQWLLQMMAQPSTQLRASSIKRYYGPVYRYVVPAFHGVDAATATGDGWLTGLQAALDAANDGMAPTAIVLFADFLLAQPDIARFEPQELEGFEQATNVSANLISVADFERAARSIRAHTERDTDQARLIAALGFYAGLRRGEALHVRIGDLSGNHHLWLFVRSSGHHRLKRTSSQRKLPLGVLLPGPWLEDLKRWRSRRRSEVGGFAGNQLLFCPPADGSTPLEPASVIDPGRDALRAVTGDRSLVFHHLRHSFANWTLLRLLAPELDLARWRPGVKALDHPWFDPEPCRTLRAEVLAVTSDALPARNAGYALARLLGHSEVATSLHHYVHLADLAAYGCQTAGGTLTLPDGAMRALLGLEAKSAPFDAAYHRWRRLRPELLGPRGEGFSLAAVLARAQQGLVAPEPETEAAPQVPPEEPAAPSATDATERKVALADIPAVLGALFTRRLSIARAASDNGLPSDSVERIKNAASHLAELRTRDGKRQRLRVPPHKPHDTVDREDFKRICAQVEREGLDLDRFGTTLRLAEHIDPHHGNRVFLSTHEDAVVFLALLESLGLPRRRLRVNVYAEADEADAALAHWQTVLGLPREQFRLDTETRPSSGLRHGQVTIDVLRPRRLNRLPEPATRPPQQDYDPELAKRALPLLPSVVAGTDWTWTFADQDAATAMASLLRWLGLPEVSRGPSADGFRVSMPRNPRAALPAEALTLGLATLARALPFHDLRVLVRDDSELLAVLALLRAWGVDAESLALEQRGPWRKNQGPPRSAKALRALTGIPEARITDKQDTDANQRLTLLIRRDRGKESIKSWGVTYALIMLYLYAAAVRPDDGATQRAPDG